MERALEEFGRQAGLKLSFDATEVKSITTPGLTGNFSAQDGLSRLLSGSGLEAVAEPGGYVIRRSTVAAQPAVLPAVEVAATPITGPTDGYMATKSFQCDKDRYTTARRTAIRNGYNAGNPDEGSVDAEYE